MFKKVFLIVFFNIVFLGSMQARDQLYVVGSSTVYPFATVVAENFGQKSAEEVIEALQKRLGITLPQEKVAKAT